MVSESGKRGFGTRGSENMEFCFFLGFGPAAEMFFFVADLLQEGVASWGAGAVVFSIPKSIDAYNMLRSVPGFRSPMLVLMLRGEFRVVLFGTFGSDALVGPPRAFLRIVGVVAPSVIDSLVITGVECETKEEQRKNNICIYIFICICAYMYAHVPYTQKHFQNTKPGLLI